MDSSFIDTTLLSEPVLPVSLKPSGLRPVAYRVLSRKHGLNIQSDALEVLANFVGKHYGVHWRQDQKTILFLEAIARLWKQQGKGLFVSGEGVDEIINEILENEKRAKIKVANTNNEDTSMIIDPDTSMAIDEDAELTMNTSLVLNFPVKTADAAIDWMQYFKSVDFNHYANFKYDKKDKQYIYKKQAHIETTKLTLPRISNFVDHFTDKLHLLRARSLRNEYYCKASSTIDDEYNKSIAPRTFTLIKNLLGRGDQRFVLFGMLTLNSLGLWQLQDDSDKIELVLDQCIFPEDGYFLPGNFLIVDGFYSSNNKFHVLSVTHPPSEQRPISREILGKVDCQWPFSSNGNAVGALKSLLKTELKNHPEHKLIFLGGNLYLNDSTVLALLRKTFHKLEEEIKIYENMKELSKETGTILESSGVPVGIVLIGSFYSKPITTTEGSCNHLSSTSLYKSVFDNLAALMENFPKISNKCKLFIVPGEKDPWMSMVTKDSNAIWPQNPIAPLFLTRLRRVVKHLEVVGNPCRINYLGHEISVVKDELGARLRRNDISYLCTLAPEEIDNAIKNYPSTQFSQPVQYSHHTQSQKGVEPGDKLNSLEIDRLTIDESPEEFEAKKIVKTILDQGDLSPFVSSIRPISTIYWNAMNLTPLPHFILLSDQTSPTFTKNYKGCEFSNVGNFAVNGHAHYIEYYPHNKYSRIQDLY